MDDYSTIQSSWQDEEPSQFDYKKLLVGFWKRKWMIVFLSAAVAAFLYYLGNN